MLLAACSICCVILFTTGATSSRGLHTPDGIDSLVREVVSVHESQTNRVRYSSVKMDSSFSRSVTSIYTPPSFSKTSFHFDLQTQLQPYGIELPGRVHFPDRDMDIHLLYKGTIWHTVRLISDNSNP